MKIVWMSLRLLFTTLTAALAFAVGLFIPLWALIAIGKDPGNIGGGLLTMGLGFPIGIAFAVAAGWFGFRKTKFLNESQ